MSENRRFCGEKCFTNWKKCGNLFIDFKSNTRKCFYQISFFEKINPKNQKSKIKNQKSKIKNQKWKRKKWCLIVKLLDPKIDYVFKRIFGYAGNEEITAGLLSSILNKKVSDLKLDSNPILEKDLLDDKVGILDIKAKIDNDINCDIELQVVDRKNIEKRILFYWSKMYNMSIKEGEDYNTLEKGIVILISDYELKGLKNIEKYITRWNIREEEYQKIILTDVMEIYIIELPKFEKYKEKTHNNILNSWVKFINNPEVKNMEENNKELKKAQEVLKEISQDEHERYLAELRQKYIMDQKAIEDAGYDKGLKDGLEQGLEQGKNRQNETIAKKMKKQNIDIKVISEITGLSIKKIEGLKD